MKFKVEYTLKEVGCTVLPLVIFDANNKDCVSFIGTGVLLPKNVFLTAAHCLTKELAPGQFYGVLYWPEGLAQWNMTSIEKITFDPSGTDLASARLELDEYLPVAPPIRISLASVSRPFGTDVFTYSYPLSVVEKNELDKIGRLELRPNLFKGYISGLQFHNTADFKESLSYEIMMPPLPGISGAPLLCAESGELAGLIYGAHRSPINGQRFVLAQTWKTLQDLRGEATNYTPLGEYLEI